jgi:hypothetical protein
VLFTHWADLFSSHPWWLARGSRVLSTLTVGLFGGVYLFLVWCWLGGDDPVDLVKSVLTWVLGDGSLITVGLGLFLLGFVTANSFLLAWAGVQVRTGDYRSSSGRVRWDVVAYVSLIGIVVPLVLGFIPGLPQGMRVLGGVAAFLPVALLTFIVRRSGLPPQFPTKEVSCCGLFMTAYFVMPALAGGIEKSTPDWLVTSLPRLATAEGWQHLTGVLLAPLSVWTLFRLVDWWAFRDKSTSDNQAEATQQKPRPELGDEELQNIVRGLDGFKNLEVTDVTPGEDQTSRLHEKSEFRPLFGCDPTVNQHEAVKAFLALGLKPGTEIKSASCVDMIIQGQEGSGRSLLLSAMALAGALLTGRRSLILCADDERAAWMITMLNERLAALGMTGFVVASDMQAIEAHLRDSASAPPPEICVTTLEGWEGSIGRGEFTHQNRLSTTLSLLLSYEILFVDDWAEHGEEIQAHLPVFADKRRLLLGSYDLPFQAVFCFPLLERASLRMAFNRLLNDKSLESNPQHHIQLRYRPLPATPVLRVRCDKLDGFLDALAVSLAARDQSITIFRKGIDAQTAKSHRDELTNRIQSGHGSIDVRHSFDGYGDAATTARIALCECIFNNWDAAAVGIRSQTSGKDRFWIITVEEFSDELVDKRVGESLLFLDRFAGGVWELHLRDVLRLLPQRRPADRELWDRFGLLAWAKHPLVESADTLPAGVRINSSILYEDENAGLGYIDKFPHMAGLLASTQQLESIDPWELPEKTIALRRASRDDGMVELHLIDHLPTSLEASPRIVWQDQKKTRLGTSQLAHLRDLVWRRKSVLAAKALKLENGDLLLTGEGFRGDGSDCVHPRYTLQWKGNTSSAVDDETPLESLSFGSGFQWIGCSAREHGRAHVALKGRSDSFGREGACPAFEFDYAATTRILLLKPTPERIADQDGFQKAAPALWSTTWETNAEDFLPALTFAMHSWLEEEFKGALFFGKVLAFRCPESMRKYAAAAFVFIEPETTGQTLSQHLIEYLAHPENGDRFFRALDHRLESGWDKSVKLRTARFWLPVPMRKEVTLFERHLLWDREDGREGEHSKGSLIKLSITCPKCQAKLPHTYEWGSGISRLMHCGQPAAIIISTRNGQIAAPNDLLRPWPPPESIFSPTHADAVLAVWQAVAKRLRYRHDHNLESRPSDCWLAPLESWSIGAGDCEDHAILVVSILNSLGIPSWFNCGKVDDGYHAWVTFNLDTTEYLLEATFKNPTALVKADQASVAFDWTYKPEWRCNGTEYQQHDQNEWQTIQLAKFNIEDPA